MKHGFIKVAAVTPKIRVADPVYNGELIRSHIDECVKKGAKIIVFPELCITGYTCSDLFLQELLLEEAKNQLLLIAKHCRRKDAVVFVGLPLEHKGKLYNVAAAVCHGEILGFVPKTHIPMYNEFYEGRHFWTAPAEACWVPVGDDEVLLSTDQIFTCTTVPGLAIAAEICEDLWVPNPPSSYHALAGATVIVNLSASDELTGKAQYRKDLVVGQSGRLMCGYIYASAGEGESTQDVVYSGHDLIAENGTLLASSKRFVNDTIISEIDVKRIIGERRRMSTFISEESNDYYYQEFELKVTDTRLTRRIDPAPFVPDDQLNRNQRCDEILNIQSMGLKKRLEHIGCKTAVIGISGGLDSTLALLVTVRAFDQLGLDRKGIAAVTMPGFGTTDRTYDNAVAMIKALGTSFHEISIVNAVNAHFADIGQDPENHDVTYENGQARERTQILMDLSNKLGGIVVGTGDLSELALGWATYNGDHMSMYGVNASIPKTLVRHLIRYYADTCDDKKLQEVLMDVLDTPVSPELLPPKDGEISQKTEDLVGPYELHDFVLYYVLRFGFAPDKIYRLARIAFRGTYDDATILKWMRTFYWRFFAQQFKRSCLPDGPKVGTVAVSPRGDLRMPSDASSKLWISQMEALQKGLEESKKK